MPNWICAWPSREFRILRTLRRAIIVAAMAGGFTAYRDTLTIIGTTPTANNYYVATTGSDANPGTQAAPFRTIKKAASVVKPAPRSMSRPAPTPKPSPPR